MSEIPLITTSRWNVEDGHTLAGYERTGGYAGLKKALEMTPEQVHDEVKTATLLGRGGAGFPAGIKWQTVADAEGEQKYITCNADEGDSGTFSDRILMEGDPLGLIESMMIAGFAVDGQREFTNGIKAFVGGLDQRALDVVEDHLLVEAAITADRVNKAHEFGGVHRGASPIG